MWGKEKHYIFLLIKSSSFTWPVPLGYKLYECFTGFFPLSEAGRLEVAGNGYFPSSTLVKTQVKQCGLRYGKTVSLENNSLLMRTECSEHISK